MLKRFCIWIDKRFVISVHAQKCATMAQQSEQTFDELYATIN